MKHAIPCAARIGTWEWTTTYDENPSREMLERQFEREFPNVTKRSKKENLVYALWPMTCFNSPEGRKLRYMVVLLCESIAVKGIGKRLLPAQIGFVTLADRYMKGSGNHNSGDNSGDYVFWICERGILYVIVFYEGRLCHWSEENGYVSAEQVDERLVRFREFLKDDALFSRSDAFCFMNLRVVANDAFEAAFGEAFDDEFNDASENASGGAKENRARKMMFQKACRDCFFRRFNLLADCGMAKRSLPQDARGKFLLLVLLPLLFMLLMKGIESETHAERIVQNEMVKETVQNRGAKLDVTRNDKAERSELVEEIVYSPKVSRPKTVQKKCSVGDVRIKGIVAPKLFMVERLGRIETYRVGDMLDGYQVLRIERTQVALACGRSTEFYFRSE
ncbi:MAG: hypothetical protein HUK20_05765 [Fibrobacter sp.]|nr:hypothetical protein [Fibrobacter sp.]